MIRQLCTDFLVQWLFEWYVIPAIRSVYWFNKKWRTQDQHFWGLFLCHKDIWHKLVWLLKKWLHSSPTGLLSVSSYTYEMKLNSRLFISKKFLNITWDITLHNATNESYSGTVLICFQCSNIQWIFKNNTKITFAVYKV